MGRQRLRFVMSSAARRAAQLMQSKSGPELAEHFSRLDKFDGWGYSR